MTGTTTGGSAGSGETPENPPAPDENQETSGASQDGNSEANQDGNSEEGTQSAEGGQPSEDEQAEGEPEPATPAEEPTAEEPAAPEAEAVSDIEVPGNQLDAAEVTEAGVTVQTLRDEIQQDDKGNNKTVEVEGDASDAEVTFTNGCVNDGKLVSGNNLTFKVEPGAGRVLVSISYKLSDAKEDAKPTSLDASPAPGKEEKIESSKLVTKTGAKSVTIYVKTEAAGYKISFADENGDPLDADVAKVFEVIAEGDDAGKLAKDPVSAPIAVSQDDEAKAFALVLVNKAKVLDEDSIKLNEQTIEYDDEKEFDQVGGSAKVAAIPFEVNPSEYGLDSDAADTAAQVRIKVRDKYKLTVNKITTPDNVALAEYTGTGTEENLVKAAKATGIFDATEMAKLVEGYDKYANTSLAFAVKPDDNYKIKSVTAKIDETNEAVEVSEPKEITTDGASKGNIEYTISLDQEVLALDANKTLSITMEAELDDDEENDAIRRISFAAAEGSKDALKHVTVIGKEAGGSAAKVDTAKTVSTLKDDYTITVTPEEGYALTKGTEDNLDEGEDALKGKAFVVIEETRKYDGINDPVPYKHKEEVGAGGAVAKIILKDDTTGDTNYEDGATDKKTFVTTAVTVTIGADTIPNDDEKLVAFDDKLGTEDKPSYAITNTAGVLKDQYPADEYTNANLADSTYTVAGSVDVFTFTVTSAVEPAVERFESTTPKGEIKPVTAENGVYTYSVPAKVFAVYDDADPKINKIVISKKQGEAKTAKVTVDDISNLDALNSFAYTIDDVRKTETLISGEKTLTNAPHVGDKVKMVFTAKENVTFGDVTYTMGETSNPAVIGRDEATGAATATIEVTVTDNIKVSVATVAPYYVELGGGDQGTLARNEEDGTYSADYDETNITVELFKAGVNGINSSETFYDVAIKDGSATAVTKAEIVKNVATIKSIDSKEWGKTLTIEVQRTKDKADKYTATLKVSAASDEVTVTNLKTGKAVAEDAPIDVRRDSEISFKVTPKTGANLSDLKVEIRSAKENASTTDDGNARKLATVTELDGDGEATVTVTAGEAASADPIMLCVLNKNKGADGKENKNPLKGGSIILNILDPIVKSEDITGISAVEAPSSNREVRLNLNLNLASKKALLEEPLVGDLYYRVEIKNPAFMGDGGTVEFTKDLIHIVPIPKNDDSAYYDAAAFAQFVEFNLVAGYKGKDGKAVTDPNADIPGTITAEAEVTLIQTYTAESVDGKDAKKYAAGKTATASVSTRIPVYETKLSVKKVNGTAVFTGQQATVAIPTFSKDTSYNNNVEVEFVNTKTGKLLGETWSGNGGSQSGTFTTGVNPDGSVWVKASSDVKVYDWSNSSSETTKDNFKNLGIKITANYPVTEKGIGYAATAVVKLKIQQGIFAVDADESKAALPTELYRDAKGKVKSVKITPLLNGGYKEYKPAKAAVTWAITDEDGDSFENLPSAHMKEALRGTKPLISVKNGTISVKKEYTLGKTPDDNTFYVTARANDFKNNGTNPGRIWTQPFIITGQNQTIGKLVVVDGNNRVKDSASLKAEDFKSGRLYIAAVKNGVADPAKGMPYTPRTDFIPVTFKAAGKLLTVDAPNRGKAKLNFVKPGTTKITATTVDGGKGTGTKTDISVTVSAYEKLGLELTSASGLTTQPDITAVKYFGGSNERYTLRLKYYDGKTKTWKYEDNYKNVKAVVKGGKLLANKNWAKNDQGNIARWMGDAVVVTDKSGTATITLTDTATKKELEKYTITNGSNASAKAPSIKMIDPKKPARDTEAITYQVKTTDKKLENYAGKYVKLTPDFTVDETKNEAYDVVDLRGTVIKIDENGQFVLNTDGDLDGGAYKIIATVGEMSDGEFKAAAKDAKISFNVPKAKRNEKLKVTGKYTLDAQGASTAELIVKTDLAYTVSDAMDVIKKDKDQGTNDHTNNFTKYFEVKRYIYKNDGVTEGIVENDEEGNPNPAIDASYGEYVTIGLRNNLSAADIAYITGQDKETAKQAKADCEGYITVDNGYYRQDVNVKISFKSVKLSASAPAVYASTKAVKLPVEIYNGKTPVRIAMAELDGTNGFATKKPVVEDDGSITLESIANLAEGKYDVNLKILPENAAYNDTTKATNDKNAKKVENLVATYGVPVTLKVDVKALDAKKMISVKNLNITLNSRPYTAKNGNGYEISDTPGNMGNYLIDVPYSFGADNAALAKDPFKVELEGNTIGTERNAPTLVKATLEKDVQVYDADGKPVMENGKEKKQSVIRLTVSKKVIETYDAMDRKDKPITGWNKKLTVPVAVQLANAGGDKAAVETLSFKLSIPKKPMSFAEVQTKVKEAEIGKIQTGNYTKASDIITNLTDKVKDKVSDVVPADTDVEVGTASAAGVKPENGSASTDPVDIVNEGSAVISLPLKYMADKEAKPVEMSWTYSLGVKASTAEDNSTVAETVAGAIRTYLDTYEPTNETTADSLYADITTDEDVGIADYVGTRRGNVSIKITKFEKRDATTAAGIAGEGEIQVTVRVADLIGNNPIPVNKTLTIARLSNIVEAHANVKTALDAARITAIIKECAANEELMKEAILKEAKEAAENSTTITINYKSGDTGFKYVKAIEAGGKDEDGNEVAAGRDGSLSFILELNEGGRVKEVSGEAEIPKAEAGKYVDLDEALKKVQALTVNDDGTLVTAMSDAIAAVSNKTDEDAMETAILAKYSALLGTNGVGGNIYGYKCTVTNINWEKPTATVPGKVTFTVNVLSVADESKIDNFTVEEASVGDVDPTNMTVEELKDALGKFNKVEVAASDVTNKAKVCAAVDTALKGLIEGTQKGQLKDAKMTVTVSEANCEMGTDAAATDVIKVTNVQVTVGKTGDEPLISETISEIAVTKKAGP